MKLKSYKISGDGLKQYYMIGGCMCNRTQANKLMRQQSMIDQVVEGIVSTPPIDRKKSVNFIKSLAKK